MKSSNLSRARGATGESRLGLAMVEVLRGDLSSRPITDPGLSWGLRAWIQDEISGALGSLPSAPGSLVVTAEKLLTGALSPGGVPPRRNFDRVDLPMGEETLLQFAVSALFRQWLVLGSIDDVVADSLSALSTYGPRLPGTAADAIAGLGGPDRIRIATELSAHISNISDHWRTPSPVWLPRYSERIVVPVLGDTVVMCGRADLVLGGPAADRSSVCLVIVDVANPCANSRRKRQFLSLLETLRSGAAPFNVASYFSGIGTLEVDEVDDAYLADTVGWVAGTLRQAFGSASTSVEELLGRRAC